MVSTTVKSLCMGAQDYSIEIQSAALSSMKYLIEVGFIFSVDYSRSGRRRVQRIHAALFLPSALDCALCPDRFYSQGRVQGTGQNSLVFTKRELKP